MYGLFVACALGLFTGLGEGGLLGGGGGGAVDPPTAVTTKSRRTRKCLFMNKHIGLSAECLRLFNLFNNRRSL